MRVPIIRINVENEDDQYMAEEFLEEMQAIAKKFGLYMYRGAVWGEGNRGDLLYHWSGEARFTDEDNVHFSVEYYVHSNKSKDKVLIIKGTLFGERVLDKYEGGRYDWEDSYNLLKPYFEENKNNILIEIAELQKQIDELKKLL